ncbi:MAG: HAD-IB family phosphatase [Caldisphaeraceae archaeon]|nr:HAD-IB family phosphatase [Caldisphaeraceae archaeon]
MRKKIRLVAFDVDGVLTEEESSWGYMHEHFKTEGDAVGNYERFKKGEIDYLGWMESDTRLWIEKSGGKLRRDEIARILSKIRLRDGAQEVSICLHKKRKIVVLISGGIDILVSMVAEKVGADYWFSNSLRFDKNGYLKPGGIPIVGCDKQKVLKRLLAYLDIKPYEVMYVGDSEWDYSAMEIVGYPVVFGNDPLLKRIAKYRIENLLDVCNILEMIEGSGEDQDSLM